MKNMLLLSIVFSFAMASLLVSDSLANSAEDHFNPNLSSYAFTVLDGSDNFYILDTSANKVAKYSTDGTLINDSLISGLASPTYMIIGTNTTDHENIYILDSDGKKVLQYSTDGTKISDDLVPNLALAESLAIDSNRNLFVADLEHGIVKLADSTPGQISDDIIDQADLDTAKATTPSVIHVDADTFVTVYQGAGSDGFVATYNVTDGGVVSDVIDTLEFDTTKAVSPDVIQVDADTFAVSYSNTDSDLSVATFDVAPNGAISDAVISSGTFDLSVKHPDIAQVDADTFAVSYTNSTDNKGHLVTFDVTADGASVSDVIDSVVFDGDTAKQTDLFSVGDDTYAIAYSGPGTDGFVSTLTISSNGTIGNSVIDSLEFDTGKATSPDLQFVSSDVYAIAYSGPGTDGFVSTLTIGSDGIISDNTIDTIEFDTAKATTPVITNAYSDTYAIAYTGDESDGFVTTLTINADGTIADDTIDTIEFDGTKGVAPVITSVDADTVTVVYTGDGNAGHAIALDVSVDDSVSDVIAPTFTVSGKPVDYTTDVNIGGTYTAGTIQNIIDVSSTTTSIGGDTVDVDVAGEYTVTYTVTDSMSNSATITETVTVSGTEPEILSVSTDNYIDEGCANEHDQGCYIDAYGDVIGNVVFVEGYDVTINVYLGTDTSIIDTAEPRNSSHVTPNSNGSFRIGFGYDSLDRDEGPHEQEVVIEALYGNDRMVIVDYLYEFY